MKRAYVLGDPVAHSRSPELFARFAAAAGVALTYERRHVLPADLAAVLDELRADPDVVGANVTLPHKERALALADDATDVARTAGAANVLTRNGGRLLADSTDVTGIEVALAAAGVTVRGARVVLLGCGGVARAAAVAMRRLGAGELTVAGRNPDRVAAFASAFAATPCTLYAIPSADLYIQATPLGMSGAAQHSLLPRAAQVGQAVLETVYTPAETPFVREARERRLQVVLGEALFVAQAAATFERWFGVRPETVPA